MAKHLAQYEVLRELGSGAFGSVSLGVGSTPGRGLTAGRNRFVALKQLKADADSEAAAQLEQEFALLDGVKHRCIVRVFEYLKNENTVVMEYIHGVDLRT
ncbi:MAG: protein kinase, partial [Myxococcota bacterium]|nr:protein kinase [Myxococcota bacterium]